MCPFGCEKNIKEIYQLYGIIKEIRNTNISVGETISRILDRLESVDVLDHDVRIHIENLFKQKLEKEIEKRTGVKSSVNQNRKRVLLGEYVNVIDNKTMKSVGKGKLTYLSKDEIIIRDKNIKQTFDARIHHFEGYEPLVMLIKDENGNLIRKEFRNENIKRY